MSVYWEFMEMSAETSLFSAAVSIAMYVLSALGLYTIAKRRTIKNPWLAWIPVGTAWILGSISDQYQFSIKQKKTGRRKVLMGLEIALVIILVIMVVAAIFMMIQVATIAPYDVYEDLQMASYSYGYADIPEEAAMSVLGVAMVVLAICLVMMVVAVVYMVFAYMSYYDLYMSCNPSNATVFLVLSIFFSFLTSIFVFVCRNKDEGMRPPMPPANPWQYPGYQPPYGQGGYQPPYGQGGYPPQQPYQQPYQPQQPQQPQQPYQQPYYQPPEEPGQSL